MNVEMLRAFVKVVELGGVTSAARALRIAQPAISRKIHALESEFGKNLFFKTGRKLQVTPFGYDVYQHARSVLSEMDTLNQLSQSLPAPRLRIGASLTTLSQYLPRVVSQFRDTHPEVQVSVLTGRSDEVYDMITEGRIEIGVVSAPIQKPYFTAHLLFEDPCHLICPATHPLATETIIEPTHLHEVSFVTMTNHTKFRQDLNLIFAAFNVEPYIRMEIDNIDVIERMVKSNLGVTLLPESVWSGQSQSDLHSIPFIVDANPVLAEQILRRYSVIHLKTPISAEAQSFVDICQDVAAHFSR